MLSSLSESFAQRNFYGNLEIILIKVNQQKLNLFKGLAHGEKLFSLRCTLKKSKMYVFEIKLFYLQRTT